MSLSPRAICAPAALINYFINGIHTSLWRKKQDRGAAGSWFNSTKYEHSFELVLAASSNGKMAGYSNIVMSSIVNILLVALEALRKCTFKGGHDSRYIKPDGERSNTDVKKEICNAA